MPKGTFNRVVEPDFSYRDNAGGTLYVRLPDGRSVPFAGDMMSPRFGVARLGSLGGPVGSLDSASGFIPVAGGDIVIPANTLIPGRSKLVIDGMASRRQRTNSSPADVALYVMIGINPAFGTGQGYLFTKTFSSATAAPNQLRIKDSVVYPYAGVISRGNNLTAGQQGVNASFDGSTAGIDHTSDMYIRFYVDGMKAGSTAALGDVFDLSWVTVDIINYYDYQGV